MSKIYFLFVFVLVLYNSNINAQTADSCRADFQRLPSTNATTLSTGFEALPWQNHDKRPEEICWNFGDNHDTCIKYDPSLSNNYFVSHSYLQTGVYNVCVKILYQGGCQSSLCKSIEVGTGADSCKANFEAVPSTSNALGEYFIAQPWSNHNKKPVYICWNFGDNHDTCVQYATNFTGTYGVYHLYSHNDNYNVCVKIQYDGGCESDYCKTIRSGQIPDSCSANFESGLLNSTSLSRHFVAHPWHNNDKKPVYICWNFGDNHDTCIQYATATVPPYSIDHRYAAAGQYEVCVRIVYDGGCESKKCNVIRVGEPDSCYVDFEKIPTPSANNPLLIYYRALPKINTGAKPQRICWSFGDGTDSCFSYTEDYTGGFIVSHHYDHSGMYEVCAKINYYGGCEAAKCKVINIFIYNHDTCSVHLYQSIPSVTSLTREFYFVPSSASRAVGICWNFGDGSDTCITGNSNTNEIPYSIRHTYPAPGIYQACVKVLFLNGCTAYQCIAVNFRSLTDLCGGYYSDSLLDPHTYLFNGFSVHEAGDAVTGYRWTFGDGSSGTGEKVSHSYPKPGLYRVCLLINTEKGCEARICNEVSVAGETQSGLQLSPNPVADVLHVLFYSSHNETVTIKIMNSNGIVIRSISKPAVIGQNLWDLDAGGLMPGIYSLLVQSADQFSSALFFKQ